MGGSAYLDNSTITCPSDEALSRMLFFCKDKWGTPSQPHQMGQELFPAIEEAWKSIYHLLGAIDQDTIVLTSSSAEAINHAFLSTYQDVSLVEGKNHFITCSTDDAPSILSAYRLEKFGGAITFLKPNEKGIITPKNLIEAITPRTALFSISWANGLTGVLQPISELAEICKLRGVRFLVDATHVLGKIFFDLKQIPIDLLAFNGDQIHAPKGSGGIFIRSGIKLSPFITGGIEQIGLRAGNVNVPGLVALGVACKQALEARDYIGTEIARLKLYFEKEILKKIPHAKVLFEYEDRLPHVTAIAFPGIINEALLYQLNQRSVFASIGGGSQQHIGYLLAACAIPQYLSSTAISFSLSRESTEEEMNYAVRELEAAHAKLKKASSHLLESREYP